MIKKLILLLSIFLFTYSYSQVGIETSFPKGALHIDGNKDNPKDATSTISNVQQSNDFIISQTNGNVGIGTTSPTTKLIMELLMELLKLQMVRKELENI